VKGSIQTDRVIEKLKEDKLPLAKQCTKPATEDAPEHVCSRADDPYCAVYAFPNTKWRIGDCPMADTELKTKVVVKPSTKVRVGQQKQKKSKR